LAAIALFFFHEIASINSFSLNPFFALRQLLSFFARQWQIEVEQKNYPLEFFYHKSSHHKKLILMIRCRFSFEKI